ncbi:hypothetical protein F503_04917 [Ophiostoma piceae UAMH 11346]|uniref:Uncharacterized protein n=1 Tax=Ophiostoma piceae (strain UAMH 11346) TaxID=1262450 RepID=S3BRZ4_OPHP1|nr:hypothetical protein F503_04917 [Ophiostoma piceae UAMH 11346]
MRKPTPSNITGWVYHTTPDAEGITWDEAAAQLAAYVNKQNFVELKGVRHRFQRLFWKYPSLLSNHENLPLRIRRKTGQDFLHIPVMPVSQLSESRKVGPGPARIVYVEGIHDTFDIIYHDDKKTKHENAKFYPYSMAEKKRLARSATSPPAAPSTLAAPSTNIPETSSTSTNRFASLATRADNNL